MSTVDVLGTLSDSELTELIDDLWDRHRAARREQDTRAKNRSPFQVGDEVVVEYGWNTPRKLVKGVVTYLNPNSYQGVEATVTHRRQDGSLGTRTSSHRVTAPSIRKADA